MLFLVFQLGVDRYAIEAAQVVEILPVVNVKQLPRAPRGVSGLFDYHGGAVPLIDLAELALGKPAKKWMSTRIILTNYRDPDGHSRLFGLLAERATETMQGRDEDFTDPGLGVFDAPYLGGVLSDRAGIIQRVQVQHLLAQTVGSHLFQQPAESL
jgi:chemotaxis-related protein WspB